MAIRTWTWLAVSVVLWGTAACGGGGGSGTGAEGGAGGEGALENGAPRLSIADVSVEEGDRGSSEVTFTVTLSKSSESVVRAKYETGDDTAVNEGLPSRGEADYDAESGSVRFEPGETEQTFRVTVNGDEAFEQDEQFLVVLSDPEGAEIEDGEASCTIVNDDDPLVPMASISGGTVVEGNSGTRNAVVRVTLSEPGDLPVMVDYATADGTATAGEDYTETDGTLMFMPGETSKVWAVPVLGDDLLEGDETFSVTLTDPENAVLDTDTATVTIRNDDVAGPALSIGDATITEGNSGAKQLSFTISLSPASPDTVSVDYATIDDTASASGIAATGGLDYVSASESVSFAPGETTKVVSIAVNGDVLDEDDESFLVELFNPENAVVLDPQATGNIQNDDLKPTLSVQDAAVTEGAAGSKTATFFVSLSQPSGREVSVGFATSNGTASAGQDYEAASGTLVFSPGMPSAVISIMVYGDVLNELSEDFFLNLSGAQNATVLDGQAKCVIGNDDPLPELTLGDVALLEQDSGSSDAVFEVTLSQESGRDVSVNWATSDGTATTAGGDYAADSGTVTFPAGTTTRQITVTVNGDTLDEPNETFGVSLSGAVNALIADGQGVGTIIGDDTTLPILNIADAQASEGNAGTVTLSLTVSLDTQSAQQVSVDYATGGGSASAGSDYQAASGTLVFDAGETSKTVDITVNGDGLDEPDETVLVVLSGATNAAVGDGDGVGVITDDDASPSVSIDDVAVTEGNSGTKTASFTISLSQPSGFPISVTYASMDGSAVEGGSASVGQDDYEAASDVVLIAPGETSASVDIAVNGDTLPEGNETFLVQLSSPLNATLADAQGQGTITNDDALPTISIGDVSALEGDAGTKTFTFTLTLSAPSGGQISVSYATADGTALSGSDYTAKSGSLVFAPGQTVASIGVIVIGEKAAEAHNDETFYVNLSNAVGATIADAQGVGTILSDD